MADLCSLELNLRLNKKKTRKRKKDRNAAHWRPDSMTKLMKTYAAEDAMVGLEIFRNRDCLSVAGVRMLKIVIFKTPPFLIPAHSYISISQ